MVWSNTPATVTVKAVASTFFKTYIEPLDVKAFGSVICRLPELASTNVTALETVELVVTTVVETVRRLRAPFNVIGTSTTNSSGPWDETKPLPSTTVFMLSKSSQRPTLNRRSKSFVVSDSCILRVISDLISFHAQLDDDI